MVDDLDRLRDEEVVDAVRLVRLVGDFPNLVYVLAFDRPAIEASLGSKARVEGRAYLDKIVHLSHELPRIRAEDLSVVLDQALDEAIGPELDGYRIDQGRMNTVFWMTAREFFHTIRDVRRYANVLPGALRQVGEEIDLADLMALEALRLFEPEAYEATVDARDVLTRARSRHGLDRDDSSRQAERIEAIFERSSDKHRPAVKRLIGHLFPLSEEHLGGTSYDDSFKGEWRAARLVAESSVFHLYLHRRLPSGELPAREVEEAVKAMESRGPLDELLSSLSDERLARLFMRLTEYESHFPPHPKQAIGGILHQQARRSRGPREFFSSPLAIAASRLIYRLLHNLESREIEAVVDDIEYPNLSGRAELIRMVGHRPRVGQKLVSEQAAERLEVELAGHVLRASASELALESEMGPLLTMAQSVRGQDFSLRLLDWIRDDRFLVCFLSLHKLISRGGVVGSGAVERTVQLNWPALTKSVSVERLAPRIEEVDSEWVKDEFDDDAYAVWRQAERYKDDPRAAEHDIRRYENDDEEDFGAEPD